MSNDEYQQQNYWKSYAIKQKKMTENPKTWIEQQEAGIWKKINADAEKLIFPLTTEEWFYENCDTVLSIERPNSQENGKVVILPIADWHKVVKTSNNYENKNTNEKI